MAKRAEEDLFRFERQEHRLDPIDLHKPIAERTGAVIGAHRDGKIQFGHEFTSDGGCGGTLRNGTAHSSAQSARGRAFSSGVTSITRARPVIFTSGLQLAMHGVGFQNAFSVVSRSSS